MILITIIIAACSNQTLLSTHIPSIQPTNTTTPTLIPTVAKVNQCQITSNFKKEWAVKICDEFINNINNWWVGSDSADLSSTKASISNGKYTFDQIFKPTSNYLGAIYQWYSLGSINGDYLISIDGIMTSKHNQISWGIGIRGKGNRDFYTMQITNNGGYFVQRLKDGKFTTISSFRNNSNIRWNEINNLTVIVVGNSYNYYVNDELIFSKKTENSTDPYIYLVLTGAEGTTINYEFDNLLIKGNR
jgi:hypothetical protein